MQLQVERCQSKSNRSTAHANALCLWIIAQCGFRFRINRPAAMIDTYAELEALLQIVASDTIMELCTVGITAACLYALGSACLVRREQRLTAQDCLVPVAA
jgi:hypothetical protein